MTDTLPISAKHKDLITKLTNRMKQMGWIGGATLLHEIIVHADHFADIGNMVDIIMTGKEKTLMLRQVADRVTNKNYWRDLAHSNNVDAIDSALAFCSK